MRRSLAFLVVVGLFLAAPSLRAESLFGTDFWFAWPFTSDVRANDPAYDVDAQLVVMAQSGPADVRVVGPSLDVTVTAAPGAPAFIRIPRATGMLQWTDLVATVGFHAFPAGSSCEPFALLFRVPGSGASVGDDVARLIPTPLLGLRYMPVAYYGKAEFIVVATESGTTVTITDPNCSSPAPFVMNRGDAFLHECAFQATDVDVTGTIVDASAPVYVMSGSADSRVIFHHLGAAGQAFFSYSDQLLESPWPAELFGRTHVHAPFRKNSAAAIGDLVRVVSGCAGSHVDALEGDGTTWARDLAAAGSWSDLESWDAIALTGQLVSDGVVIDSTTPIEAASFTVGNSGAGAAGIGDPSMSILDPVERWEREAVAYLPDGYLHSVGIVAPASAATSVVMDGSPVPAGWRPVGDGRRYLWLRLDDVPAGEHRLSCAEPFVVEVSGYLDPTAPQFAGAYSYPAVPLDAAGPNLLLTGVDPCRVSLCPGPCFSLTTPAGTQHVIDPGGLSSAARHFTVATCPDQTVTWRCRTTDDHGCDSTGEVTIDVLPAPLPVTIAGPTPACVGSCFDLTASSGWVDYTWDGGATGETMTACPTVATLYAVTASIPGGCSSRGVFVVNVYPPPVPGPAQLVTVGPCPHGVQVSWTPATWRPGSPGGVYDVYRREGTCAPAGDVSWRLIAVGLGGTTFLDGTTRVGVPYSYLVVAEDAPAPSPCNPGPYAGGPTAATCATPEGILDPGDPDAALLISLSPYLRAVGYERIGSNGPCTAVTFTWGLAPTIDPRTHAEIWRSDRADLLTPLDVSLPGTTWRDADPTGSWLYFYKVFNATACGDILEP